MSIFINNGFLCLVEKDNMESIEEYIKRGYFVAGVMKSEQLTKEEYYRAVVYSRIMINVENKGCCYNREVMEKLSDYNSRIININDLH